MPLSIRGFDADGNFVSIADLEPRVNRTDCRYYAAARAYRVALEVPQEGLGALSVGPDPASTSVATDRRPSRNGQGEVALPTLSWEERALRPQWYLRRCAGRWC